MNILYFHHVVLTIFLSNSYSISSCVRLVKYRYVYITSIRVRVRVRVRVYAHAHGASACTRRYMGGRWQVVRGGAGCGGAVRRVRLGRAPARALLGLRRAPARRVRAAGCAGVAALAVRALLGAHQR